jgi:SagB-type dehydrogenase family enzyme
MNVTTAALPLFYRLREDVEMQERQDGIIVVSPSCQVTISRLHPHLRHALLRLAKTPCSMQWINRALSEAHEEGMLTTFYKYLSSLLRHQMACICAGDSEQALPAATLLPISQRFHHRLVSIQASQPYRMSRFAYMRRDEDGSTYLESPLAFARLRLERGVAASVVYQLGAAVSLSKLASALPEGDEETITGLLALLVMGNFASPVTSEGLLREDEDETLRQWEFHDLLFHSRCREGRHDIPLGGTYRFLEQLPPQPAIKQAPWPATIFLPRPDFEQVRQQEPGLAAVMETRTSIREYGSRPITLEQLGEFLYRVARVKEIYSDGESGDFTRRPYPGAGASYELEFYLTVDQCEGLAPGFYWYHPLEHALAFIHEPDRDTERLVFDAYQSMGELERPQILVTLAARFQRVAWKYQGIAYSLILKDVGVVYATMYLVASAMGLAGCALGTGDSDQFVKVSGTEYLKETSVGEFALGSRPTKKP